MKTYVCTRAPTHTHTNIPENPGEGGESDFQSYHIIRFKCPGLFFFGTQDINHKKVMVHSKEKKIETILEKMKWWT